MFWTRLWFRTDARASARSIAACLLLRRMGARRPAIWPLRDWEMNCRGATIQRHCRRPIRDCISCSYQAPLASASRIARRRFRWPSRTCLRSATVCGWWTQVAGPAAYTTPDRSGRPLRWRGLALGRQSRGSQVGKRLCSYACLGRPSHPCMTHQAAQAGSALASSLSLRNANRAVPQIDCRIERDYRVRLTTVI